MGESDIALSHEERQTLEAWVRATTTERRMVMRARIILDSADGHKGVEIARRLGVRPATVSRWRQRFLALRLKGLQDRARPGRKVIYGLAAERRLLEKLDEGLHVVEWAAFGARSGSFTALRVARTLRA